MQRRPHFKEVPHAEEIPLFNKSTVRKVKSELRAEKKKAPKVETAMSLITRAQQDPVWWMTEACGWNLWEKQKEIAKALVKHERVAVPAAFGVGKTYLAARLSLWFLFNHYPSKVITTAPCYHKDTEILTDRGWKLFRDLDKTELVASLEDGKMVFVKPSDYIEESFDGVLIDYTGLDLKFSVTPNHRCWVSDTAGNWGFREAEDIFGSCEVGFNRVVDWEGVEDSHSEEDYYIWGRELFEVFSKNADLCGIPSVLKQATKSKLRSFILGYSYRLITDGDDQKFPKILRVCSNLKLVDDLHEMICKAGWISTVSPVYDVINGVHRLLGKELTLEEPVNGHNTPEGFWSKKPYTGMVYCVTVPSGILFVRYKGCSHWNGNTTRQVKELLWSELRTAYRSSQRPLGGTILTAKLNIEDDWFAVGFSTKDEDVDKFTGYHSPHQLLIFDQACGIPRAVWEAGEGLMVSEHVRWLAISNTTDEQSEMANICIPDRRSDFGLWEIVPISAYDSPNYIAGYNVIPGIISHDWINKRLQSWGVNDPLFQIFVNAQFVEAAAMVIIPSYMRKNLFKELEPDFDDIEIGIDIADEGMDSSVWVARAGKRLLAIDRVTGNDPMQVVKRTMKFVQYLQEKTGKPVNMIRADKIGAGSGVVSRLQELDMPVVGINVAESPVDTEQFLNLKAEISWEMRNLAESSEASLLPILPTPQNYLDMLEQELTIRYKLTETGKIKIEEKKEVRKRLKRSPDIWDALILAYHGTVIPKIGLLYDEDPVDSYEEEKLKKNWEKMIGLNITDEDFAEPSDGSEALFQSITLDRPV